MTHNNALLRLAKIVESIASGDGPHWPTEDVRQLIRDLEAAPQLSLFVVEPHPAVLRLKQVDVNQMTPLEAMKLLDELSRLARDG